MQNGGKNKQASEVVSIPSVQTERSAHAGREVTKIYLSRASALALGNPSRNRESAVCFPLMPQFSAPKPTENDQFYLLPAACGAVATAACLD